MVASLNRGIPAREAGYEMMQYISSRLTLVAADSPANVKIGTIPAGSVITGISSRVATAVTGGTPVLAVGGVSSGAAAPTFPLSAGNTLNATIAETAGSEWLLPTANITQPLANDLDVYVGTSGGATAGDVVVAVFFIKPLA
jgi:hypothetical protein